MPSSVGSDDLLQEVRSISQAGWLHHSHYLQESWIVDIDAIQSHGINVGDISKLKSNGYYTIASVHAATRRNLLKIKGFSEIKVEKIKDALVKCQVSSAAALESRASLTHCATALWRWLPDCPRARAATQTRLKDIDRKQAT